MGVVALSAAAGGGAAWFITHEQGDHIEYIERTVERAPALGTHFTAYESGQYPDLT